MNRDSLSFYPLVLGCLALLGALTMHPLVSLADGASDEIHVIDITNLRNTVTNFGSFGSVVRPYPSCEWPAWSENLYLHDGELWVGGVMAGDTAVTTGRFSGREWSPVEGIEIVPELSAFSDEDTYTRYEDLDGPGKPGGHLPLGILVSQRTMAWAGADFIVHDLLIENVSTEDLTDVYVGFCWDFNIARLAGDHCGQDDLVGFEPTEAISYMFDDDGDGGLSPGYIGGSFLNEPLAGHGWYTKGQEPLDDAARYALLSGGIMADPSLPDDYRLIHSVGPFDFPVGRKIPLLYALAIGQGQDGLQGSVLDAVDAVGRAIAASGDSTLCEGEMHEIMVNLGEIKKALGRHQFAVDWEFCDVGLTLVDPEGQEINPETALSNPLVSYVAGPHRKAYEVVNPIEGEWRLFISYITGPECIDYGHTVAAFDVPHDFGLPMETFEVTRAYIRFHSGRARPTGDGNFWAAGHMELKPEASFDPAQDPVIFAMGSYQETIPPGSFTPWGPPGSEIYVFWKRHRRAQGILFMALDFQHNQFYVVARRVDMTGTENPVPVRLAIGPDTGFEEITMQECGNRWYYPPR